MCGFSGFYNPYINYQENSSYYNHILLQMNQALSHRGPDESNHILYPTCGLSHTRLSIIDLLHGQQPMKKIYHSQEYAIAYNGEVYNSKELREDLINHGFTPDTTSDTELLLLSYLAFGPDFVSKVDGIFAFAIFDSFHNQLILYRDPFGVKPLFYTLQKDTCIFSSELKGIRCFPHTRFELDRNGLCELLGLGPARNPGSGVYKNMKEVLPGTFLKITKYGCKKTTYHKIQSHPHEDDYETTLKKTNHLVTSAIKKQMISDVPICTFLSGGVDSSIVSAICANELKKKGQQLTTFSFRFTGNEQYFKATSFQPSMDEPFAEKMVSFLQTKHTTLECDNKTQAKLLIDSCLAHDLPCMADIDSSLLFFCSEVSKSHKVVLTGECADEIFGGYPWFHRDEFLNANTFPWTPNLKPRTSLIKRELKDALKIENFVQSSYENAIAEVDALPGENQIETNRRRISYLNIRYFMQTLLNRMDRTSMSSGLEARVPFADKTLVDYVFNTPWNMKAKDGLVKNLLRQSMKGVIPDEILFRQKSPYPKTYDPHYESLLKEMLLNRLSSSDCSLYEIYEQKELEHFLSSVKNLGKPWYGQLMAGPQMIAYLIQMDTILSRYHVSLSI